MRQFYLLICSFFIFNTLLSAQTPTQTIRGKVTDADSHFPLFGATVVLLRDSSAIAGATTDEQGNYKITGAPVGRYAVKITYVGYNQILLKDIIITSAKEFLQDIQLQPSAVAMNAVTVSAEQAGQAANEMATVSSRNFSVEETDRYAGSRGDPARMASNYAGVQGADDSRDDMVIRGNSPSGVLWELEGVDIFNPNHFAVPGTTGGPVSILNNKSLGNSDFYTGAFPAEYGNGTAGVFDLNMRNGNNQQYEFSGQLGFLGTEVDGEGPISKANGSSFLFTYRYSTLALFNFLNVDIGTSAIPYYQDASFRLNFPLKNNADIAIFGIGGLDNIYIIVSNEKTPAEQLYGQSDRNQYLATGTGYLGATYTKAFNVNTFTKFTLMAQDQQQNVHQEIVFRHTDSNGNFVNDSITPVLRYNFTQQEYSAAWLVSHRFSNKLLLKAGINADTYHFNFIDSAKNTDTALTSTYLQWQKRWNDNSYAELVQPYIELKYTPTERFSIVAGLHSLYFTQGNALSPIEPRLGLQYDLKHGQTLALGTGLYSQIQPTYIYFYNPNLSTDPSGVPYNENIGLTKSEHIVLSYTKYFCKDWMIKAEAYEEHLFDVPVETQPSSFSLVNTGADFSRFFPDTLKNTGLGNNYGLELTVLKSFSHKWYAMFTGSLFQSRYEGSDGIWRNTDFDGMYAINFVCSKEFVFKNKNTFEIGGKVTLVGGRWYGPVDTVASVEQQDVVYADSTVNTKQFPAYFRADAKLAYTINRKKVTHEIGIDLVNIFNTKNVLDLSYSDVSTDHVVINYQLGFLPLFYYRIDFHL